MTGQQQVWKAQRQKKRTVVWLQSHQAGQAQEGQETIARSGHLSGPGGFEGACKNQNRKGQFLGADHQQRREPAGRLVGSITEEPLQERPEKPSDGSAGSARGLFQ
jgi:hypothetical protein